MVIGYPKGRKVGDLLPAHAITHTHKIIMFSHDNNSICDISLYCTLSHFWGTVALAVVTLPPMNCGTITVIL